MSTDPNTFSGFGGGGEGVLCHSDVLFHFEVLSGTFYRTYHVGPAAAFGRLHVLGALMEPPLGLPNRALNRTLLWGLK